MKKLLFTAAFFTVFGLLLCPASGVKSDDPGGKLDTAEAYLERGITFASQSEWKPAIADFNKAIRLDRALAAAWVYRGRAYAASVSRMLEIEEDFSDFIAIAEDGKNITAKQKAGYKKAIANYTQAIKLDPNFASAYRDRGVAYSYSGDYGKALADFDQAVRLNPNDPAAYRERGNVYYFQDDDTRALADYNQAINVNPDYASVYINRGKSYHSKKEYDKAIDDFNQAIKLNENYAFAYNGRGNAYRWKRDYDLAIKDFTEAIRLDPNYAEAYRDRGFTYASSVFINYLDGEDVKDVHYLAIADYTKALELDPNSSFTYENRAEVYVKTGDYDRAIADFTKAIKLNPNNAWTYSSRGDAYEKKGNYDLAIADYTKAIKLNPNYLLFNKRGDAYKKEGDYDRAIADFTKEIELETNNNYFAYLRRGDVYKEKGDYDRAIADYTKAIELDPNYVFLYLYRGDAYKEKGDYNHAIADYTKAIELDPNYASAYNDRGNAYSYTEDYNLAIADYTQALELAPNDATIYNNRGYAYWNKGDNDKAIADYTQAIELDPNYNGWGPYGRGDAYFKMNDYSNAIADYNEYLKDYPDDDDVKEKLKKAKEEQKAKLETYRVQDGYAIVQGKTLHYLLYDTISNHDGNADRIYNRIIPDWVREMGYGIDFSNKEVYNPNPNLASSVKNLMQQRGCNISAALVTERKSPYVVINEYFESSGTYKTTFYDVYLVKETSRHIWEEFNVKDKYLPGFIIVGIIPFLFISILFGFRNMAAAFSVAIRKNGEKVELLKAIDIFKFYGKITWFSAPIGFIIGIVSMLRNLDVKAGIGPYVALALIPIIYSGIINAVVILPFTLMLKKQLAGKK